MFVRQELYGGAITTVLPQGFLDASTLRNIPDTQEVFVNNRNRKDNFENDGLSFNESIIFDLLEAIDDSDNFKALQIHLEEIFLIDKSETLKILNYESIKPNTQSVIAFKSEFQKDESELLVVCMSLIRLETFNTDVVISVNIPMKNTQEFLELQKCAHGQSELPSRLQAAYNALNKIVKEFRIVDNSLFV